MSLLIHPSCISGTFPIVNVTAYTPSIRAEHCNYTIRPYGHICMVAITVPLVTKHNFKRLYLMQAVYCTQLHNYGWKWLLTAIQFMWPNYIVESSHTSRSHLWSRISGVSLSLHLTICSHFLANPSSCPWPCGNQVPRCLLSLGHHCPAHHLARPLTQADLTCCWSVLVGIVVVPCYPSLCPWPCGNQVPRHLLSLGHHCPAHYSAQPLTQADLTRCRSVLVGNVAVPCYPSMCPGHRRFRCHCAIIAPSVCTLLLMYTA